MKPIVIMLCIGLVFTNYLSNKRDKELLEIIEKQQYCLNMHTKLYSDLTDIIGTQHQSMCDIVDIIKDKEMSK